MMAFVRINQRSNAETEASAGYRSVWYCLSGKICQKIMKTQSLLDERRFREDVVEEWQKISIEQILERKE